MDAPRPVIGISSSVLSDGKVSDRFSILQPADLWLR